MNNIINKEQKFKEFANFWIEDYARKTLKPETVGSYESMLKVINESMGNMSLERIRPQRILDFCNQLSHSEVHIKDVRAKPKCDLMEILTSKNMSRTELSKKSNIAPTTITSVMRGNNVERKTAKAIAKAIGMQIEDLFELQTPRNVSEKTVENYKRLISSILQSAVDGGVLTFNVAKSVVLPKKEDSVNFIYVDDTVTAAEFSEIL